MATLTEPQIWYKTVKISEFPEDGGACIKYKDLQIAVYNFTRRGEWYAVQNMCPHKMEMALSRGMIGTKGEIPKVACPFHKKTFSLISGENLDGEDYQLTTYPVKIEDGYVFVGVPE